MTAARLGIDSVDIGNPMIAMHSIREMAGAEDQLSMIKLLTEHFS
jgi:aspartyl aminopeptidase